MAFGLRISKEMLVQGSCFALAFFVFNVSESVYTLRAAALLDAAAVSPFLAAMFVSFGAGLLSFPALRRVFTDDAGRENVAIFFGCILIASTFVSALTFGVGAFVLFACFSMICAGHLFAAASYSFAMTFSGQGLLGRALGISMCAASLLQYAVQWSDALLSAAFLVSVVLMVASLMVLLLRQSWRWSLDDPAPVLAAVAIRHRGALVAAVAAMAMVYASVEGILSTPVLGGVVNMPNEAHVVFAASVLAAGIIHDAREGRYTVIAALCALIMSMCCVAFISVSTLADVAALILSGCAGFYVLFLTAPFMAIAPHTASPELWAGVGLVARVFVSAPLMLLAPWSYGDGDSIALLVVCCTAAAVSMVVLLPGMVSLMAATEAAGEDGAGASGAAGGAPLASREDAAFEWAQVLGLTPRETEVLVPLVATELGVQDIADSLYISRRVAQRHIAAIYEKAQVSSRIGLFQALEDYRLSGIR